MTVKLCRKVKQDAKNIIKFIEYDNSHTDAQKLCIAIYSQAIIDYADFAKSLMKTFYELKELEAKQFKTPLVRLEIGKKRGKFNILVGDLAQTKKYILDENNYHLIGANIEPAYIARLLNKVNFMQDVGKIIELYTKYTTSY